MEGHKMAIDQNQDIHDFVPQDTPVNDYAQNAGVTPQTDPGLQQQFAEYTQAAEQQFADYTKPAEQQFTDYTQAAQQQFTDYTQPAQQQFTDYTQPAQQQFADYAQPAGQPAEQPFGFQQNTAPYQPVTEEVPFAEPERVEKYDTTSDLAASVPVDTFVDPNAGLDAEPLQVPGVSKAFTIFRKNGSSVSVLIGAVLLGIAVLYSLVNPVLLWSHIWPDFEKILMTQLGSVLPATFIGIEIQKVMYWGVLVMTVLITLPMVLYVIGLLMYAIRARRHELPGDEDVGLTPLKVGMVIYLVCWILTFIGCGYAVYTSVRALMAGVKLSPQVWSVLILQAVWLAIEILGLIYFIKSIRMVKAATRVYATGEMPKHNLPLFVIVINYILIVLNIAAAFPMILAGDYAVPVLLNYAMLVLNVAAGLLLNIPLHIARSELKRARESE